MNILKNRLTGKITLLVLGIALFSSCQKETAGPAGPPGPAGVGVNGTNGQPGTYKMIVDSFYLSQSSWTQISQNVYQYSYSNPKITQEILTNAIFQVSSWYPNSGGYWVAWPLAVGSAQYLYYYKLNTIILQANATIPPITSFKIVILPK
jgi:hypothetical protein